MGAEILTVMFLVMSFPSLKSAHGSANFSPNPETFKYEIPLNGPLLDTVVAVSDYGCGTGAFCNESLASYPDEHCFKCPRCKCDSICHFYGDCCPDVLFKSPETPPVPPQFISCFSYYLKWTSVLPPPSTFMITSCPEQYTSNDQTKLRCEQASNYDLDEATFVSVGNLTYRNMFCAICHKKIDFTRWQHKVECNSGDFLTSAGDRAEMWKLVMGSKECSIRTSPPTGITLRLCEGRNIDRCNVTGLWKEANVAVEGLCGAYYHPVSSENQRYRNIFCAVCNGVTLNRYKICFEGQIVEPKVEGYPLSVLIDFNPKPPKLASPVETSRTQKCNSTSIFDPIMETCQTTHCSVGRTLSEGQCEPIFQSSKGLGYSGSVFLRFDEDELPSATWQELLAIYLAELRFSMAKYTPFSLPIVTTKMYSKTENAFLPGGLSAAPVITGASVDFNFISLNKGDQLTLENDLLKSHHLEIKFRFGTEEKKLKTRPNYCPEVSQNVTVLNPLHRLEPPNALCPKTDTCDVHKVQFFPVLSIIDCPYLEYDMQTSNFTFNGDNSTMEIYNQTFNLSTSEYQVCGNIIKICSSALSYIEENLLRSDSAGVPADGGNRRITSFAEFVVSTVCLVVSMLCLLLTFVVYCALPQLRTLPGKNTLILVASLFLAQLLFVVGIRLTENADLCRAMGILIHFVWVVTFTTMGVCAFHMHSVFTHVSSASFSTSSSDSKTIMRYLLVIFLAATVVVVVCIAYHAGMSGGSDVGYGGDICFLNKAIDIGIFFAGPLAVILVLNTVFFVRVVIAIRKVPNMDSVKNKSNKRHINVYFRLSVLLGFTWIFGFIAAASQVEALWYVFDILNGLQGLFVFVAYCVNKRTIGMLQGLCPSRSETYKSSTDLDSPVGSTVTSSL